MAEERNYWLHRIKHEREASVPLLNEGSILTIGFGHQSLSTQSFIAEILASESEDKREELFRRKIKEAYVEFRRWAWGLWYFLADFKKGDCVLVPSPYGHEFSIYELVSGPHPISNLDASESSALSNLGLEIRDGKLYRSDKQFDLGFYWKVSTIAKGISKWDYADAALTAKMKSKWVNLFVNNVKDSIEEALARFRESRPTRLSEELLEELANPVLNWIVKNLNPKKFEKLVALYLKKIGATAVDMPPQNKGDKTGDADVVAIFEPMKHVIYVQVKFFPRNTETDEEAVKQVSDYRKDQQDDDSSFSAWVISSANAFTEDCRKLAEEEGVFLINGMEFVKMLLKAGIPPEELL